MRSNEAIELHVRSDDGGRGTPIVRLSPRAHALLRQIADEEQQSMQAVLDKAIERYHR